MASVDDKGPIVKSNSSDGSAASPESHLDLSKDPNEGIPNPLQTFQTLVGIRTPEQIASLWPTQDGTRTTPPQAPGRAPSPPDYSRRPHPNPGIYHRVVKLEKRRKWQYRACKTLIDACFIAQIGFAAILTALGASGSPHNVITVFGAINTAIAGLLALLKGQGLPTRLRQDWVGLRRVRDYIEDRERIIGMRFALGVKDEAGAGGDVVETLQMEVQAVLRMYEEQVRTMEDNRPDVYVLPTFDAGSGSAGVGMGTGTGTGTGTGGKGSGPVGVVPGVAVPGTSAGSNVNSSGMVVPETHNLAVGTGGR